MKYVLKEAYSRIFSREIGYYISRKWVDSHYDPALLAPGPNGEPAVGYSGQLHQEHQVDFKWILTLNDNVLSCTFKNQTENVVFQDFDIPLSIFANAPSQSLWIITDKFMSINYSMVTSGHHPDYETPALSESGDVIEELQPTTLVERMVIQPSHIENSFAKTLTGRGFRLFNDNTLIMFFVVKNNPTADDIIPIIIKPQSMDDQVDPSKATPDQTFNGIKFTEEYIPNLSNWADHTLTVEGNLTALQEAPIGKIYEDLMSHIHIGEHTIDGDVITVNFTTDDDVDFIWLEKVVGHLPKEKIAVTNKAGSFKIIKLGLDSGDVVETKLGYRYWVNKETFRLVLP